RFEGRRETLRLPFRDSPPGSVHGPRVTSGRERGRSSAVFAVWTGRMPAPLARSGEAKRSATTTGAGRRTALARGVLPISTASTDVRERGGSKKGSPREAQSETRRKRVDRGGGAGYRGGGRDTRPARPEYPIGPGIPDRRDRDTRPEPGYP